MLCSTYPVDPGAYIVKAHRPSDDFHIVQGRSSSAPVEEACSPLTEKPLHVVPCAVVSRMQAPVHVLIAVPFHCPVEMERVQELEEKIEQMSK